MFSGATSFNQPLNNWDVSSVTDMGGMRRAFMGASSFSQPLSNWDVSVVKDMSRMFSGATSFNQSLDNWDVSSVENMEYMFSGATSFNQPLNNWSTDNLAWAPYMFSGATAFNQPLDSWDVSNILSMEFMFYSATAFDQSLDTWNVANVTDMRAMFAEATNFNQPLNNWDVSAVTDMGGLFAFTLFNQPLNNWDVSSVAEMDFMFQNATAFNQPLNDWNTSSVWGIQGIFSGATSFNQPIGNWDVSNVSWMEDMFYMASSFNQDLSSWDISNAANMTRMFTGSALSTQNYDNALTSWSGLTLQNDVDFDSDATYCAGSVARTILIDDFSWIITDGGQGCIMSITSTNLTSGSVGQSYAEYIAVENAVGSLNFSIINGNLPQGVTMNSQGFVTGVPTQAGTFTFTVQVQDDNRVDSKQFVLNVVSAAKTPTATVGPGPSAVPGGPETLPAVTNQSGDTSSGYIPLKSSSRSASLLKKSSSGLASRIARVAGYFKTTPIVLVQTFPWAILLLLVALAIAASFKLVGQIVVIGKIRKLLARQELLNHEKKSVLSLASHYLRTPLTILGLGTEMLPDESKSKIKIVAAVATLRSVINSIVNKLEDDKTVASIGAPEKPTIRRASLLQRRFILPVVAVALLMISINILAIVGAELNPGAGQMIVQLLGFMLVASVLYFTYDSRIQKKQLETYENTLLHYQGSLDRVRNEFVHEVINILIPAIIAVDSSVPPGLPEKASKFFTEGLRQLEHTAENFILISQLEKNKLQQKASEMDIASTIHATRQMLKNPNALVSVHIPMATTVSQPEFLMRKVFGSLLDNAVEYSEAHMPTEVSSIQDKDSVTVAVKNHGQGIPAEKLSLLFKPLSRVEAAEDFTHQGIGLSLYVNRLIMHYLGGEISANSTVGEGTTMQLKIPNALET